MRDRAELLRKLAILAVVLIVLTVLRWPWYVLGLFLDTAPNLFPNDFTAVYHDKGFASIMFQGRQFGLAGPLLVASSAIGAILSLRSSALELRAAAWMVLACIATFSGAGVALTLMPHWIFPPPIYFEVAAWPLYSVFAGIVFTRLSNFVADLFTPFKLRPRHPIRPHLIVPLTALALAAVIVIRKPTHPINYPFPPQVTPVVAL